MFILDEKLAKDTREIGQLSLCQLLLMNDARFVWVILVPKRALVSEIYQLSQGDQQQLMAESCWVSEQLQNHFNADSMNVAALGNVVAQLHVHHVVRFEADPVWPLPVWGQGESQAYTNSELTSRIRELQDLLLDAPSFNVEDF